MSYTKNGIFNNIVNNCELKAQLFQANTARLSMRIIFPMNMKRKQQTMHQLTLQVFIAGNEFMPRIIGVVNRLVQLSTTKILTNANNFISIDRLEFNGTFSTIRLYRALKNYSSVKLKISVSLSQLKILRFGECNNSCER